MSHGEISWSRLPVGILLVLQYLLDQRWGKKWAGLPSCAIDEQCFSGRRKGRRIHIINAQREPRETNMARVHPFMPLVPSHCPVALSRPRSKLEWGAFWFPRLLFNWNNVNACMKASFALHPSLLKLYRLGLIMQL